ncbi:enoyl-CoA hydratase/isomerase family protein [Pigmentibacter sp. JX0631]|uniref:enoyl-CoA hydratase/isomerase family protein n=1 Tax=Pigmentibacter sp. JX0631 TaxID=2976982 RepID=UPI002469186E|nr:enoyl-CoA hydratase/isomerase family protein [Pigmentibacter sp. JX0631]WGL58799.1 enoyl-CoA hydratase/isomerase family protein [Pigmentibacter sp. JX0631]
MQKLVDDEEFSISSDSNICFVTLNSKSTKNAISFRMAKLMQDICSPINGGTTYFEKFIVEQSCQLIILNSEVKGIFSSGGNLIELTKFSAEYGNLYTSAIYKFCSLLHQTSAISISVLTGPAYGGGAELALATDFRWGVGKTYALHFTQAQFGLPTGWGGMLRLAELCPQLNQRKIATYLITKTVMNSKQLIQNGLVDKEFSTKKACFNKIKQWSLQFQNCPKNLKEGLFARQNIFNYDALEEYDKEFFRKHFLTEEHKNKINLFLTSRKKRK